MVEVPQSVVAANWIEEILLVKGANPLVLIILIRFLENQKEISISREPIDIQVPGSSLKAPNFRMSRSNLTFTTIQVSQTEKTVKVAVIVIPLLLLMIEIIRQLNPFGGEKLLLLDGASPMILLLTAKVITTFLNLDIKQEKN
jgi:hypothetical protein